MRVVRRTCGLRWVFRLAKMRRTSLERLRLVCAWPSSPNINARGVAYNNLATSDRQWEDTRKQDSKRGIESTGIGNLKENERKCSGYPSTVTYLNDFFTERGVKSIVDG